MQTNGLAEHSTRPGAVAPVPKSSLKFSDRTVVNLVSRAADRWPDDPFARIGQHRVTFSDAFSQARRVASAFQSLGCERGDVVALFMPTCPEFIDCYLGGSLLGLITFPVNTSYRAYLLKYSLNDSGGKVIISELSMLDRLMEVIEQLPHLEVLVVLGANESDLDGLAPVGSKVQLRTYDSILAESEHGSGRSFQPVDPYDANSIIYTSGTTGPSKGVLMSNAHVASKGLAIIDICQLSKSDVIYAPIPLFHTFGLHRGVIAAMVTGLELVVRERFSASSYWSDVAATGASVGFTTASMVQILKNHEPLESDTRNGLRCMFAAPYDPEFEDRFDLRLLQTFSLTEANNAVFSSYDDPPMAGTCGKVSPDWQVKLVDDDGEDVAVGEPGEILLRPLQPGQIMLGYHNQAAATRNVFRDLWLHTGDLGSQDEAGYFSFLDRKKDAIRRRGENISSWEVERILAGHPAVLECTALAYPSPLGEDDVRVIVTLKPGYEKSSDLFQDIAAYCQREMPDFMTPRYIEIRAELPKTPTEKVLKAELRKAGLGPDYLDCGDRGRAAVSTRIVGAR